MALNSWFPITICAPPFSSHRSDDLEGSALLGTSVDQVSYEHRGPLWVAVDTVGRAVPEADEQSLKLVGAAVESPMMSKPFTSRIVAESPTV